MGVMKIKVFAEASLLSPDEKKISQFFDLENMCVSVDRDHTGQRWRPGQEPMRGMGPQSEGLREK